ncbi:hypothetical protein SAMN03159489_04446 [Pseudomonas sp. NFPP07]|uniref:hypothetical protein n=1 Tax=Pseudomonas sp. NFPP07 TaxID=1566213 RepID=UPI0008E9A226|nr:hypothetical protein [Pseudomonas sp. NFPP07]SFQ60044.1 hypothetical protein SAMN03159489_04446 [Pseudomonas sp. NFPP07]
MVPLVVFFGIEIACPNASKVAALADGDMARAMKAIMQSCGATKRGLVIFLAVVFIACFSLIDLE